MFLPDRKRQFRVLYRDFLSRMIDLDVLSARGELQALLGQFAAMLGALSFVLTVYLVPRYGTSLLPHARLMTLAWLDEEFLIGVTMAIAGMFTVLAWNAVLPDRRDALVLGTLPVSAATICRAKVAALATSLGVSVFAINAFTGLGYPVVIGANAGLLGYLRSLAAYFVTMIAAATFVSSAMLALQGVAAQLLSYRLFQRVSNFLQIAAFFAILGVFFLKPPFATVNGLTAPRNQLLIHAIPTYWFLGLFQMLNGSMHPIFAPLAVRAVVALAIVLGLAAGTYVLTYQRGMRRIVEQPDIAPQDRSRPASRWLQTAAERLFAEPLDRAIVLFTARTIARSRQHRLILAIYAGIGLAISMAYLKSFLYGSARSSDSEVSLLIPSVVMMVFAVVGARAVFALPIALPANWIFRITSVHSPRAYFSSARKALAAVAVLPMWLAAVGIYLAFWPGPKPWGHFVTLALLGAILVFSSMRRFRKIPFACAYLPGKANLKVKLGMYGILFLFLCDTGVRVEHAALRAQGGAIILTALLTIAALWTWWRTQRLAASPHEKVVFEETPAGDLMTLNLEQSGGREAYIDDTPFIPREPVSLATRMEQSAKDLALGFRALIKAPGFSAAAVVLMALGIGGNTAIYSLIHGILTKPAAGVNGKGLVSFGVSVNGHPEEPEGSFMEYLEYSNESKTVRPIAAARFGFFTMTLPDGSYELRGQRVTENFFETLGVRLARGRAFTTDEAHGRAGLVAVLAYPTWQNEFHGAGDILGRTVLLNGCPVTVIGVTGEGFRGSRFAPNFEIGVPLEAYERLCSHTRELDEPRAASLDIIGRLAPRASLSQARAEIHRLGADLQAAYPEIQKGRIPEIAEYSASAFSPVQSAQARLFMRALSVVGLLTLLVVCANVANLMLARSVARQREMAVRRALGAAHSRILRLLFAEGLAISLTGAAASWLFAQWATRAIVKLIPKPGPGVDFEPDFSPDSAVAVYALILATLSALAFTAAPALRAWRQQILPWLKAGEHGVAAGRSILANVLAGAQLALCVVLLTAAGLASRSLYLIGTSDLHFKPDHLLVININTSGAAPEERGAAALLERLRTRIAALPGLRGVSYASAVPPTNMGGWGGLVTTEGSSAIVRTSGMNAGPRLLETLGVPVLEGRGIEPDDVTASRRVAVINHHLADTLWPGENPLGRTVVVFGAPQQVVGVTVDAAMTRPQSGQSNFLFLPERQIGSNSGVRILYVRYATDETAAARAVRSAVREVDARVPVSSVRTMQQEIATENAPQILIATLLALFSVGSLIVAAIGLYAVVAFHTARRTREFGIRLALGAGSGDILAGVLRDGLLVTAIGAVVGVGLSLVVGRAFASLLVNVAPTDLPTYIGVIALVTAVSLTACAAPARRASRVDPVIALRQE